jgi:bleomycin hydrolase
MASKQGILDLGVVDYNMVFDTKVNLNLCKAERLIYGDSEMNHAMVLTGVHIDVCL